MLGARRAIEFAREALSQEGIALSELQEIVLEASWEDVTYEQISEDYSVKQSTLENYIAPQLWKRLSSTLGQKVGKKSFRRIVTPLLQAQKLHRAEEAESSDSCIETLGAALPNVEGFVGREDELDYLHKLVSKFSLTLLTGIEGIGKKSLLSQMIQSKGSDMPMRRVLWKPLYHAPDAERLEKELLNTIGESKDEASLIEKLNAESLLLVIESLDSVLTQRQGSYRLDAQYVVLFQRVIAETQSKIVIISSYPVEQIDDLILRGKAISYTLRGLSAAEARAILGERWSNETEDICEAVGGNPLLLKKLAGVVDDVSPELINRLTVQYGLVGSFYEQLLKDADLSDSDRELLKKLAEATKGLLFSELLLDNPSAAARIKRLISMGLASRKTADTGEGIIRVEPLFGLTILGH